MTGRVPLFEAEGIVMRFGGVVALRKVSVTQFEGETLGMIGPNGSGKTTFVNVVTGHLAPQEGRVRVAGAEVTGFRPHRMAAAGITRTYQAVRVFRELTIADNIATATVDAPNRMDADEIAATLDWLQLGHRLAVPAGSLTLFEQRRLEILMRLVQRARLIMLDEPVGGLSATEVRAMLQVLGDLRRRTGLFVIEHAMKVIRELADSVVVMLAGEKLMQGTPAEILADKRVVDQYLGRAHA
jgi:ABC-type branched-subunit amino acid transport system ATPase component